MSPELTIENRLVRLETLVEVLTRDVKESKDRTDKGFAELMAKIDSLALQIQNKDDIYDHKFASKEAVKDTSVSLSTRLNRIEGFGRWALRIALGIIITAFAALIIKR